MNNNAVPWSRYNHIAGHCAGHCAGHFACHFASHCAGHCAGHCACHCACHCAGHCAGHCYNSQIDVVYEKRLLCRCEQDLRRVMRYVKTFADITICLTFDLKQ